MTAVTSQTRRVARMSPALPPSSSAKTAAVFQQPGSATLRTTAATAVTRATFALKKLAPTSNLLARGLDTVFPNLGSAMETMTALTTTMNWIVRLLPVQPHNLK